MPSLAILDKKLFDSIYGSSDSKERESLDMKEPLYTLASASLIRSLRNNYEETLRKKAEEESSKIRGEGVRILVTVEDVLVAQNNSCSCRSPIPENEDTDK